MLFVYAGNDVIAVRNQALATVHTHATGNAYSTLNGESFIAGSLREAVGASSLFGGTITYLLDTPSLSAEFQAELKDLLKDIANSTHIFVVIEGVLLAPDKKSFQKHTEDFSYFESAKEEKFNVFAMGDALLKRDKKTLWLLLQKAKLAGLPSEAIAGTLWWQIKSMLLVARTSSAAQSGLHSFVYEKTKKSLQVFSLAEIENLAYSLLTIYHQGHAGETEFDLALEQWTLSV